MTPTLHPLTREEIADYPRCDSAGCWCRFGPRVVASTGAPYRVRQVASVDGPRTIRIFAYEYGDAA